MTEPTPARDARAREDGIVEAAPVRATRRREDAAMEAVPVRGTRVWEETGGRGPMSARDARTRITTDPENVERDLTRLVLTLVELVRQLVERQCIRRFDQGDLSDEQVETIGMTLMRLEEAMEELCDRFGLSLADLNLDLGPLGTLLPTDDRPA